MDPTSAYYAALYSQAMSPYGMPPYAAAAGMRGFPGMPPAPQPPAAAAPPPGASGMDLLALHAMMSRGAGAAAANPYAGYPPGLSGLLGFPPGFPPAPPSSGRKDP